MNLSDVILISLGMIVLFALLLYPLRIRREPPQIFLRVNVKSSDPRAVEFRVDSIYSDLHLQTFTYALTSKSELEGILLTFILDKFKYEVGIADNFRLRDCILDGRDFYLNISSDKTKIKLTVIYQKSEPRIKRSCLPQIQPSTD